MIIEGIVLIIFLGILYIFLKGIASGLQFMIYILGGKCEENHKKFSESKEFINFFNTINKDVNDNRQPKQSNDNKQLSTDDQS